MAGVTGATLYAILSETRHHVEKMFLDLGYLKRMNSHQTLFSEDLTTDIYNLAALFA